MALSLSSVSSMNPLSNWGNLRTGLKSAFASVQYLLAIIRLDVFSVRRRSGVEILAKSLQTVRNT